MSTYGGYSTYGGIELPVPPPPTPPTPVAFTRQPAAAVTVPQFAFPFRLEGGDFAYSEQDTNAEIADCVQSVIRYPVGYRIEKPQFGTVEQEFRQGGADARHIQGQIDRWEPRADAITTAELDELVARVLVEVQGGR